VSDVPQDVLNLPLQDRALLALRSAVKKAIAERTRQGLPVYIWSGGKVVDLTANRRRARSRRKSTRPRPTRKHR
jgi:hypothetical protein